MPMVDTVPRRHENESTYSYHDGGRPLLQRRAVTADGDSDITLLGDSDRSDDSPPMQHLAPKRPRARRSSSARLKTLSMAQGVNGITSLTMMGGHTSDMTQGQFRSYDDYKVVNLRYNQSKVPEDSRVKPPPRDLYANTDSAKYSPRQSYLFRKGQTDKSAKRRSSYQPNYRKSQFDPVWRKSGAPPTPEIDATVLEQHARRESGERRPSFVPHSMASPPIPSPVPNKFATPPMQSQLRPQQPPYPTVSSQLQGTPSPPIINLPVEDSWGPAPAYQTSQWAAPPSPPPPPMNYEPTESQPQAQHQNSIPLYHLHPNARKRKFQSMISRLSHLFRSGR